MIIAARIADILTRYYNLSFIRKPEFMGFNGYNDGINRTAFNPRAWGGDILFSKQMKETATPEMKEIIAKAHLDQNHLRMAEWLSLMVDERDVLP